MTSRLIVVIARVNLIRVAVGRTIADRPPHRSVQARLRIRFLPRMRGGEAGIGIGMQRAGLGNPPGQDSGETSPSHLCALAAADKDASPQPAVKPLLPAVYLSSSPTIDHLLGPGIPEQMPDRPLPRTQGHRHPLPRDCQIRSGEILGGLHHEYWLEKCAS
jgi:hypothetical protein